MACVQARHTKNNPKPFSELRVGKAAFVEGIAQCVVAGGVPESLKPKRLVQESPNSGDENLWQIRIYGRTSMPAGKPKRTTQRAGFQTPQLSASAD
jgi:hypothetical protein